MSSVIEAILGRLLYPVRGHDAKLFTKAPAFGQTPSPTIKVTCPECPGDNAALHEDHTPLGKNMFPSISWDASSTQDVVEWAVVVEDPDAPLPAPVVHGLYFGIPASKTTLENKDFERVDQTTHKLKGGFQYGLNRRRTVWSGPRPVLGHGVHRYMFQVVGLKQSLDLAGETTDKDVLLQAVADKIVAWGIWEGTFERR